MLADVDFPANQHFCRLWHPAADGVAAISRRAGDRVRPRGPRSGPGASQARDRAPRADGERAAGRDGDPRLPDGGRRRRQALRPDPPHPPLVAPRAQGAASPARPPSERNRVRPALHRVRALLPGGTRARGLGAAAGRGGSDRGFACDLRVRDRGFACDLRVRPPLLSSDIFNYVGYAPLEVVHGLNPYVHPLSAAPIDPFYVYVGWPLNTTAYGPLYTIGSLPLGWLTFPTAIW